MIKKSTGTKVDESAISQVEGRGRKHVPIETLIFRMSQKPNLIIVLLSPVQTDATLLANNSQHCWMLRVASVCTPCCMLLDGLQTLMGCIRPTMHCRSQTC